jgi:phage gp29-like protein
MPEIKELTPFKQVFGQLFKYLNRTDPIILKKSLGKDYTFYDDMVDKDPIIRSCLQTRKRAVQKLGWDVLPYMPEGAKEPTPRDLEVAQNLRLIIKRMKNFSYNIYETLSAYEHGFSVSEIMFRIDPDFVVISDIKHRCPNYFRFNEEGGLLYTTVQHPTGILLPPEKFIVYTFDPRYEDPYGNAMLRTAYWPYWFKTNLIKFLLLYAERFGQPTVVGQYPRGMTEQERATLLEQLEQIQNDTRGIIPEGSIVNFLEAVKDNQAMFRGSIEYFDDQMRLIILGQTLTSSEGQRSGSLALGNVHEGVRSDILAADAEDLSYSLTEQVLNPLIDYNFGNLPNRPRLVIPYREAAGSLQEAETVSKLVSTGLQIGTSYVYERFQIPKPEEGEEVLEAPAIPNPFAPQGQPDDKPEDKADDNKPIDEDKSKLSDKAKRFKVKTLPPRVGRNGKIPNRRTFDIGSTQRFYDEMNGYMAGLFAALEADLADRIIIGAPMRGLIDQAVRNRFGSEFNSRMAEITSRAVIQTAYDFARQFGQTLSESTFQRMQAEYIKSRFYDKGTISGIGDTIKEILNGKLEGAAPDYAEVRKILKDTFAEMKDWKAHQIAQTEVLEAANNTAFEMVTQTGLNFEAYFLVDPDSCDICQEWAAGGPYTMEQARSMGLPHIQCNDQWTFALKEGNNE